MNNFKELYKNKFKPFVDKPNKPTDIDYSYHCYVCNWIVNEQKNGETCPFCGSENAKGKIR